MDPYIEANGRWLGFHNAFITHLGDLLNEHLPAHYAATLDERVQLLDISEVRGRDVLRDVAVSRDPAASAGSGAKASESLATIEPQILTLPDYPEIREAFIEIIDLPGREL